MDIVPLHRELDLDERSERLGLARSSSLEVMAHPGFPHERGYLMSNDWGQLMERLPLGSYSELA